MAIPVERCTRRCTECFTQKNGRRLVAEWIGTFFLTLWHAGLALSVRNTFRDVLDVPNDRTTVAANGMGSGLSLLALIYSLGHVSGAHFNPAVSLLFVMKGDFSPLLMLAYWVMQVSAGFAAAGILDAVFSSSRDHGSLGANYPKGGFSVNMAFWMEFLAAIFHQLIILGTATRGSLVGAVSAVGVGSVVASIVLFLSPYGGGSVNPARSIGPGVLTSNTYARDHTWIYVVAPLASAVLVGPFMRWLSPTAGDSKKEEVHAAAGQPAP